MIPGQAGGGVELLPGQLCRGPAEPAGLAVSVGQPAAGAGEQGEHQGEEEHQQQQRRVQVNRQGLNKIVFNC